MCLLQGTGAAVSRIVALSGEETCQLAAGINRGFFSWFSQLPVLTKRNHKSSDMKACLWRLFLWASVCWSTTTAQDLNPRHDPTPIIYPGQVNIGILADIHSAEPNETSCGELRQDAVQQAMAAVWSAHQVNFRKEDPQELNIGVYIFDTCGKEDVAQRQVYRLLGHVGHVQSTACSEKRIPPLFAVITEGNTDYLKLPLKLINAFGVPVISASNPLQSSDQSPTENSLTASPTTGGLARAAVSVLRQLKLLQVAVIAEDSPPTSLFSDFSHEAMVAGMQAFPVDHPAVVGDPDNFLASLQVVSEYGRSRLKAVVFLVGPEQALDLLRSVDDTNFPQMPWVIITSADISPTLLSSFTRQELHRLQQVLLLSPERIEIPEFQEYFQQLLKDDTIKYHPLLQEFARSAREKNLSGENSTYPYYSPWEMPVTKRPATNTERPAGNQDANDTLSFQDADVSSMVKAVWTLAEALKIVQHRSCRRGTDCLLYLRRSLSSYVLKAAKSLDFVMGSDSSIALQGNRIQFREDGTLSSVKFSLKGFTRLGDIQEVGWYSDETGLVVDNDVIPPFDGFKFKEMEPDAPPTTSTPTLLSKYKTKSSNASSKTTSKPAVNSNGTSVITKAERGPILTTLPLENDDYMNWKILDDSQMSIEPGTYSSREEYSAETDISGSPTVRPKDIHSAEIVNLDDNHAQHIATNITSYLSKLDPDFDVVVGPSYRSGQPSSSNFRSISMTSHNEPKPSDGFRSSRISPPLSMSLPVNPPAEGDSHVVNTDRGSVPPMTARTTEDVKVTHASKNLHLSAWLGRPWALTILGLCGFGVLVTLYILVFLMVKACEGSLKKNNSPLAVAQLLSLLALYVAASLFTWKPSALLCGLQRFVSNVSYAFCFGCLLLKGMHLRAQNSLGLGGRVNRINQLLTLLFIVGVQVALETQWWVIRPPSMSFETMECHSVKEEILESQGYISFLLLLSVAVAVSTRKIPYNYREGRCLIATTLTCLAFFLAWDAACWLLPDTTSRNIAAPVALIVTAIVVLGGIFGPQLFAIHKYGGFPHKPLSYADSLSTVFTMFKDLDNTSSSGTTGRGKKNAKTLETPFGAEAHETTRNPLYSDYQSAYP